MLGLGSGRRGPAGGPAAAVIVADGARVILAGVWLGYRVTLRSPPFMVPTPASASSVTARRALQQQLTETSLLSTDLGEELARRA
jgi:hypothetical protein